MANLIDQLLSATGLKAPASEGSQSKYRDDGKTGVERYLATQAEQEVQKAASEKVLTGVEKYLQKQADAGEGTEVEHAKKVSAPATGVAKYLEKQAKVVTTAPIKKPVSGVDKYIAEHPEAKKKPAVAPKRKAKPVAKKPAPAKKARPKSSAATKASSKASSGTIDLSKDITRCQAGTSKGDRCKRTTQLMKIHRTIGKQKYQFTVCSQHDIKSFKPYKRLIKA